MAEEDSDPLERGIRPSLSDGGMAGKNGKYRDPHSTGQLARAGSLRIHAPYTGLASGALPCTLLAPAAAHQEIAAIKF